MSNNSFYKIGISTAIVLMILELTYINAKSLLYIVDEFGPIDKVFSIIGSAAFSMVTILVMRRGNKAWMKIVFPFFDSALVFCGFNLKFAHELTSNPVALGLTIFMALFTGLIMFSLGSISIQSHVNSPQTENNSLQPQINSLQTKNNSLQSQISLLETQNKKITTENNSLQTELKKYKTVFVQAEKSRILKKKPENRTPEELDILNSN